jgi:hypothetical protein
MAIIGASLGNILARMLNPSTDIQTFTKVFPISKEKSNLVGYSKIRSILSAALPYFARILNICNGFNEKKADSELEKKAEKPTSKISAAISA